MSAGQIHISAAEYASIGPAPRRAKYGNRKVVVDNITFDSVKESRRYGELKMLERAGEIFALTLQPEFPLVVNGVRVCLYRADFSFYHKGSQRLTVEDVKGVVTREFSIKRKLMRACLGIEVVLS